MRSRNRFIFISGLIILGLGTIVQLSQSSWSPFITILFNAVGSIITFSQLFFPFPPRSLSLGSSPLQSNYSGQQSYSGYPASPSYFRVGSQAKRYSLLICTALIVSTTGWFAIHSLSSAINFDGTCKAQYRADWSQGMNGWRGTSDNLPWKTTSGNMLSFNGSVGAYPYDYRYTKESLSEQLQNDSLRIFAPCHPTWAKYTVEAQIRALNVPDDIYFSNGDPIGYFGIVLRSDSQNLLSGYNYGVRYIKDDASSTTFDQALTICADCSVGEEPSAEDKRNTNYEVGSQWHTYFVEVNDDTITCFVDQKKMLEWTDNRSSAQEVGLTSSSIQIDVRSFVITPL